MRLAQEEAEEEMTGAEALDAGRRLARRRMAWFSFLFLLATGIAVVSFLILSPGRMEIARALGASSVILTSLLTVFTAIVLAYLGVSLTESISSRKL